jgi:3',5'-cyclic AMP phosphodiesterase CpdA
MEQKSLLTIVDGADRKKRGETVIAHLSDLHFLASDNAQVAKWDALITDFQPGSDKPPIDIIAVTGDLINASFKETFVTKQAFNAVHDLLMELCRVAGVSSEKALFVIPGNHDVRLSGIIGWRKLQVKQFHDVFGKYFRHAYLPKLRTFIYPFDSNVSLSLAELAAGSVSESDFPRLATVVGEAEKLADWDSCTRVALLHHHPMPIAATEHRSLADLEEFLLLRNAGMFMEEIVRRKFDLVLHGHKHFPAASRATFLGGPHPERVLNVVAGGSAGVSEKRSVCYNLLTVRDSGTVDVLRRQRRTLTYEAEVTLQLVTYEQARAKRFETLARSSGERLRVEALERVDSVQAPSGDDFIHERYIRGGAVGQEPVSHCERIFYAVGGYFVTPSYKPARVKWKWDAEEQAKDERSGAQTFDPPLQYDDELTFENDIRFGNAMHFSRRDRLDATGKQSSVESSYAQIAWIADRFSLAVCFPDGYFPADARLVVHDETGARDYAEEKYCAPYLTRIEPSRTLAFAVDRPLPHFWYTIEWELPEEDPAERVDLAPDQATASAGIPGQLKTASFSLPTDLAAALAALRDGFGEFAPLADRYDMKDLDVSLFTYDAASEGLRCYSTTAAQPDDILREVIKPGREIVGQAYRRHQLVAYVAAVQSSESVFVAPGSNRTAVVAVPLFYPILDGRRAAIVSLASRSPGTWLAAVHGNAELVRWTTNRVWLWWADFLVKTLGFKKVDQNVRKVQDVLALQ